MEVAELLAGLDGEIAQAEDTIGWLTAELAREQQRLSDMRLEAKAVHSAVQRLSGVVPESTPDPSWLTISGVGAVERALQESGPLHLQEIIALLVRMGRKEPTVESVSADLSYLKRKRASVNAVGNGRWDYVRTPLRLVGSALEN